MPKLRISWNEYGRRLEALREHMRQEEMDAYLITNGVTIFYYSHFYHMVTERPAALLVEPDGKPIFMGPLLESDHLKLQTPLIGETHIYLDYPGEKHPMEHFSEWLTEKGYHKKKIGTDNPAGAGGTMGYTGPPLTDLLPNAELVKDSQYLWDVRVTKSEEEINLIKESCKWGNLAHTYLQEYTRPGLYDVEVRLLATLEATSVMRKTLGSHYETVKGRPVGAGFRGQVGWKSAIPHSIDINRPIKDGDVLVTGAGADIGGYGSELERTMIVGKPTAKMEKMFNAMCKSQEAAADALKPGNTCADVDKAANKVIKDSGYWGLVKHHTGHGLGLLGHEPPYLDQGNDRVLEPGMVVSIEPGIYELGYAGFRHSDTLVVTEDGCEWLTYYPRDIESLTII
ncbi:MAG: Xaa-Pro peptidase family protein [Candidatus Bathyarchaeota archaeon]|nr:Xaa-Pro peptidase family protein [Candidatus Bathyarchaeota archaeon]